MLKRILIGIIGLVALLLLIGFVLPSRLDVSRSVLIEAPARQAFDEVNNLEKWPQWSYWNTLDPKMKIFYGSQKSGKGASYSWTSANLGDGKMTITESLPDSLVRVNLDFMEMGTAYGDYTFAPADSGTTLTMHFTTEFGINPIARWMGLLMMKSEIRKSFDYGLGRIKQIAEEKPDLDMEITEVDLSPTPYIGVSRTLDPRDGQAVNEAIAKMYGELYGALAKAKVDADGPAFSIFPSYTEESMEMICALPVPADANLPQQYPVQTLQGGRAIKGVHLGAYESLSKSYGQIDAYLEYNHLTPGGPPFEVYISGAMTEPDTSKWVTEIYFPVAR